MSRALLNRITMVLAIVGCVIALVLTYEHFFPGANIGCSAVGGNCQNTIDSKYGKLGPLPTSLLGLGMYLTLVGLCVQRGRSLAGGNAPGPDEKKLGFALLGISLLAFCISWWLQYVSFYVIFSFCPWCFASALTVTAIFLVNAYDHFILGRALTGEQKMLAGVVAFIGAMLAFMYAPQVMFQWKFVTATKVASIPPPKGVVHPVGEHPREELLREGLVYRGNPKALYTVIEFADYGCGHCKEASEDMEKVLRKYPDRYRLAFRNYPLGRWPWSMAEAQAAEAAARQGKFWEMHDIMFANQKDVDRPAFTRDSIIAWARKIDGLNVDQLRKDMNDPAIKERILHDHDIAWLNDVNLTPSFFVVPTDPKGKVMMIIGGTDAKAVLNDPKDPFWSGDPSSLKNPETPNPPNSP